MGEGPVDLLGHSMGGRVVMGLVLARPDLVRSLILMDTSAWSFLPEDEGIRSLVRGFIDAFDPAGGMPSTLSMDGPENGLMEAATPAQWRAEKDGIYAGMDPYAVKALGATLMGDTADTATSLRANLANIACPTTVMVGEHDHPLVDQAPELAAAVANGRLRRHCGGLPLTPADPRRGVAGGRGGTIWRGPPRSRWRHERRQALPGRRRASSWPAPMSPSRRSAWARGPGATRAPGAWAGTTSR